MKQYYNSTYIIVTAIFISSNVCPMVSYTNSSDLKNKTSSVFNDVFQSPKDSNFFNTSTFTQPFFYADKLRNEFKKVGAYVKNLLDKKTLGMEISPINKETINKAWFELSNNLNMLLNTISASRAMNNITDNNTTITEKKYLNNLNKNQLREQLENLKKRYAELPKLKNSLMPAWNDFAVTKEIKDILTVILMQLTEGYRTVINTGELILKKADMY